MVTLLENHIKKCLVEMNLVGEINPEFIKYIQENPEQLKMQLSFEEIIALYFALKS
jgi:hypothetical protein